MVDTRVLVNSTSFPNTALAWAQSVGLLDPNGDTVSTFPAIIGVPDGSLTLGAFNIGLIGDSRTIKGALQDLETAANNRILKSNNLADLTDRAAARTNLQLGTAATWPVGTTGASVPLLNTANTWSALQTFGASVAVTGGLTVNGTAGSTSNVAYNTGVNLRWTLSKDSTAESGSNAGSDFTVNRYSDAGTYLDSPIRIARTTGVVSFAQPLPLTSGGTGATTPSGIKTAIGLGNVNNTADADKPVSTPVLTALNSKLNTSGGTITGGLSVVQGANSVQMTADGSIELINAGGSPYLDFKANTNQDYILRIVAATADLAFNVTGAIASSSYLKASQNLIVAGGTTEGGQLILGDKTVTALTGQANGTWNLDVDASNNFRIFRQNTSGGITFPVTFTEVGKATFGNDITVNGTTDFPVTLTNATTSNTGLALRSNYANGTRAGGTYLTTQNENGIAVTSIESSIGSNGGSTLSFTATTAGSRTADRRTQVFWADTAGFNANVPITAPSINLTNNGSANNIRLGDDVTLGDNNIPNGFAVKGVSNTSEGYVRFGVSTSSLGCVSGSSILSYGGQTVWHAGNDGAGSGLDADLLDGLQASAFLRNSVGAWITDANGVSRFNFENNGNTYYRSNAGHIFRNSGDANTATIDSSGNFTAAGNVAAYSDARLKTNVKTILDGMDIVRKLRGVSFDKDGTEQIGLIAQEVRAVLPQVVIETQTEEKLLAVIYGNIIGVVVEALKSVDDRVCAIEEKLGL